MAINPSQRTDAEHERSGPEKPALARILVVDDEAQVVAALASHLRREYEVHTATSGDAALQLLDAIGSVAVVVSDMRMPGMDGATFLKHVTQRYPETTRILLTGDAGRDATIKAINEGGIFRFLTKPCAPALLLSSVAEGVLHHGLAQQAQLAKSRVAVLEQFVNDRTRDLQLTNARLAEAEERLAKASMLVQTLPRRPEPAALALETSLRNALQAGELAVHYQPLVDVASRRIVSVEALLRWHHPQLGEIPPSRFIPVAEESGLILPLGEWVLRSVGEQVVRWERDGVRVVPVAVNISSVQLKRQNLWKTVRQILHATGMSPRLLILELTESMLITDAPERIKYLHGLRRDGVRIHLDDFGTGYSSLSYLKRLPIDALKIDRSFIGNVGDDATDEAIVKAILTLAHSLGLLVVAEGVETAAQLAVLARHGCDMAQGYHFSRPVPAVDCERLLLERTPRPGLTGTLRSLLRSTSVGRRRVRHSLKRAAAASAVCRAAEVLIQH